jgi:hypothetical protein
MVFMLNTQNRDIALDLDEPLYDEGYYSIAQYLMQVFYHFWY